MNAIHDIAGFRTIPSTLAARAEREPHGVCLIEAETDNRISNHALWSDFVVSCCDTAPQRISAP